MKNKAKMIGVLLALWLLPLGCPKDTCLECSAGNYSMCPKLTHQCPHYTQTVQQCSGGCCTTDEKDVNWCTLESLGQILHEEIIGGVAVIEAVRDTTHTVILIDGTRNGWVTAEMSEIEVRRVMEGKLAEIRAMAKVQK
jgi:hypothetical protein